MTYETFLTSVLEAIRKRAGSGASVCVQKVLKNNGIELDGLYIQQKDSPFAPAIYLEPYYEEAEEGVSIDEIAEQIVDLSARRQEFYPELDAWIYDFSQVSRKVAFRLVSIRDNESLLSFVPHVPFLDLAVIFYLIVEQNASGQMTVLIHNEHAALWGTDARELYRLALENTPRLLPPRLEPLEHSLGAIPFQELEEIFGEEYQQEPGKDPAAALHILTNSMGINGAACILYPGVLKNFAELVKDDLFIIPSSIHEVLLSPVKASLSIDEINQMIGEVNELDVSDEERLSNHVYCYRASSDRISMPVTASASDGKWNLQ